MLRWIICVFVLVFAIPAPALAQDGETRIAGPGSERFISATLRDMDDEEGSFADIDRTLGAPARTDEIANNMPSGWYGPLAHRMIAAQIECHEQDFTNARTELLALIDRHIAIVREQADAAPVRRSGDSVMNTSGWDLRLASLVSLRTTIARFRYSECHKPDPRQMLMVSTFYREFGVTPASCPSQECPQTDRSGVVGNNDWGVNPEIGKTFEELLIYQRICDEKSFNSFKQGLIESVGATGTKEALEALKAINFVPCTQKPKPRIATADPQTSGAPAGGVAGGNTPATGAGTGTGSGRDSGVGTGTGGNAPPPVEDPLPGLDDDKFGLAPLWYRNEFGANVSVATTFDGPDAFFGQFVNTNQPVFNVPDDPDPVCGSGEITNVFGIPVPVGPLGLQNLFNSGQARVSLAGHFCDGGDGQSFRNFQSGQNFLLGQPNGGTQPIIGNILFDQVALDRSYRSAGGHAALGAPLFQKDGVMITGEVTAGLERVETRDLARFTANAINFQSTSTQDVESWSGGFTYTTGIYFSPNGPAVPRTGLQTIFVTGHAGLNLTSVDASDTFKTFQLGNFNETVRLNLSETEFTTAFGVTAGARIGLGEGAALTFEGFWNSVETPFIQRMVGQRSQLDTEFVDHAGFRGGLKIQISDRRLKWDIEPVATLENDIRLYSYRYLWDDAVRVGVMAQDLLMNERHRDAVILLPGGLYAVDYAVLGLRMATLDEWHASRSTAVRKIARAAP